MPIYPALNSTLMGDNLTYLLVYANQVTHGLTGLMLVIAFYLIVLIGSLIAQQRFTGNIRPETSFAAAAFATLGFATIIEQISGILGPSYFIILIPITILSILWLVRTSHESP